MTEFSKTFISLSNDQATFAALYTPWIQTILDVLG